MVALWLAKKKTDGVVAARPVEEPLLVAAVHDARRGAAVSTAALARGGWCEDVSGLTHAQVLEQDQSRRGRWSAAFRGRQRGLMRGSALAPPLVAVAVPLPMAVTVPVPVGRGSVLAPQPPSMKPQPSMTAPVVVELNSFGRWAGRHQYLGDRQADGMVLSNPGRSARPAADGEGYAIPMARRRTDKRSMRLYYDATEEDAISAARAR